jgi:hypothetical protein
MLTARACLDRFIEQGPRLSAQIDDLLPSISCGLHRPDPDCANRLACVDQRDGERAIENTRLFEAEQARTRELQEALEQQTATADVLKVISRSALDLQRVLDAHAAIALAIFGEDMATTIALVDRSLQLNPSFARGWCG